MELKSFHFFKVAGVEKYLDHSFFFPFFFPPGNQVFEPRNLRIYSNDSLQELLLEWDVSDDSEAYNSQIQIIFNIQVRLREENETIILNVSIILKIGLGNLYHLPLESNSNLVRINFKVQAKSKLDAYISKVGVIHITLCFLFCSKYPNPNEFFYIYLSIHPSIIYSFIHSYTSFICHSSRSP